MLKSECNYDISPNGGNSLVSLCEYRIKNLSDNQFQDSFQRIPSGQKTSLMMILPVDLPNELSINVNDGVFWKRKCLQQHWDYVDYWLNDCSWKSNYLTNFVGKKIGFRFKGESSTSELENSISTFKDKLRILKVDGFEYNTAFFNQIEILNIEDSVSKIIDSCTRLEEVYFYNFPIHHRVLFANNNAQPSSDSFENLCLSLSKAKYLQKVTITGVHFQPEPFSNMMKILRNLNSITELKLPCNSLNNGDCESIAALVTSPCLAVLNLRNNKISCSGAITIAAALKGNCKLKNLDLSWNDVSNHGMNNLLECLLLTATMERLNISRNQIDHDCSSGLINLLKKNSMLSFLNISENFLGKDVGKDVALWMKNNHRIKFLLTHLCGFDEEDDSRISFYSCRNLENSDTSNNCEFGKERISSTTGDEDK